MRGTTSLVEEGEADSTGGGGVQSEPRPDAIRYNNISMDSLKFSVCLCVTFANCIW